MMTNEELELWENTRADDAGRLAREIVLLRKELEEARERNLLSNERADNAEADAAKARAMALEEAALYIEQVNGSIENRQEHAAAIRALASGREG